MNWNVSLSSALSLCMLTGLSITELRLRRWKICMYLLIWMLLLQNMLLDAKYNVKLVDFGLSGQIRAGKWMFQSCGSPEYAAPEVILSSIFLPSPLDPSLNKRLQGKPISKTLLYNTSLISDTCYHIRFDCLFQGETPMTSQVISGKLYCGQKADLWSCGVTLYALLCSHTPFADDTIQATFNKVKGLLLISSYHHFLAQIHSWGTTTLVCCDAAVHFALRWVTIFLPFSPVQSVNSLLFCCSRRIQAPWSTITWCKGSPETDDRC